MPRVYNRGMSSMIEPDRSAQVRPSAEVLRRNVAEQLDRLSDEAVVVLHDLAQELELRAAWADFSAGMSKDWAAGKYESLEQSLAEARAALREPAAR
ncbi:MAG TPA: hypothetical protein PK529_08460 [Verrucomicrobiales bacterium]|nr:hypothetical protein [Verrucomicrobiales bacterium]